MKKNEKMGKSGYKCPLNYWGFTVVQCYLFQIACLNNVIFTVREYWRWVSACYPSDVQRRLSSIWRQMKNPWRQCSLLVTFQATFSNARFSKLFTWGAASVVFGSWRICRNFKPTIPPMTRTAAKTTTRTIRINFPSLLCRTGMTLTYSITWTEVPNCNSHTRNF